MGKGLNIPFSGLQEKVGAKILVFCLYNPQSIPEIEPMNSKKA
jgi:hypothetical protein